MFQKVACVGLQPPPHPENDEVSEAGRSASALANLIIFRVGRLPTPNAGDDYTSQKNEE